MLNERQKERMEEVRVKVKAGTAERRLCQARWIVIVTELEEYLSFLFQNIVQVPNWIIV